MKHYKVAALALALATALSTAGCGQKEAEPPAQTAAAETKEEVKEETKEEEKAEEPEISPEDLSFAEEFESSDIYKNYIDMFEQADKKSNSPGTRKAYYNRAERTFYYESYTVDPKLGINASDNPETIQTIRDGIINSSKDLTKYIREDFVKAGYDVAVIAREIDKSDPNTVYLAVRNGEVIYDCMENTAETTAAATDYPSYREFVGVPDYGELYNADLVKTEGNELLMSYTYSISEEDHETEYAKKLEDLGYEIDDDLMVRYLAANEDNEDFVLPFLYSNGKTVIQTRKNFSDDTLSILVADISTYEYIIENS